MAACKALMIASRYNTYSPSSESAISEISLIVLFNSFGSTLASAKRPLNLLCIFIFLESNSFCAAVTNDFSETKTSEFSLIYFARYGAIFTAFSIIIVFWVTKSGYLSIIISLTLFFKQLIIVVIIKGLSNVACFSPSKPDKAVLSSLTFLSKYLEHNNISNESLSGRFAENPKSSSFNVNTTRPAAQR